jgi:LPS-assembly protein
VGTTENYSRGHFFAKGLFDIDPTWRAGFNGGYTSDDTYMRLYRISSQPMIVTRPFVEGFRGNNYASAQGYYFRGLRQEDDEKTSPIVAPLLDYNYVSFADKIGGRWFGNGNLMLLTRQEGADSHRLSSQIGYTRPYTTTRGDVWTTTVLWQNDVYNVDDVTPATEPGTTLSGWTGRSLPQARLDWRYPFVREMGRFRQIIEPVASFIVAPNGGNPMKIPGEDTSDFEFDETNLFNTNRLGGLDQVESSQRVIYGLRAMALGNSGGRSELFFGQSYRVTRDDQLFQDGSGLEDNLSDYVGRLRISPSRYFDTLYRFRFNHDTLDPERSEIAATMGPRALRLTTSYLYFRDNAFLNETGSSQQIAVGLNSQMTKRFSARASMVRNLSGVDEGPLAYAAGFTYEDECFLFDASAARSYAVDRDFIPKNTFLFRVVFKTLGEFQTSGSASSP